MGWNAKWGRSLYSVWVIDGCLWSTQKLGKLCKISCGKCIQWNKHLHHILIHTMGSVHCLIFKMRIHIFLRWHLHIETAPCSLGMCPANVRRRCNATMSLIGWAHTWTDPCPWFGFAELHHQSLWDHYTNRSIFIRVAAQAMPVKHPELQLRNYLISSHLHNSSGTFYFCFHIIFSKRKRVVIKLPKHIYQKEWNKTIVYQGTCSTLRLWLNIETFLTVFTLSTGEWNKSYDNFCMCDFL